jgi:hypothetical protein
VLYIISRGILCPIFLFYPAIRSNIIPYGMKGVFIGLGVQSFYYINEMIKMIGKKRAKKKEMEEKGVVYNWFSLSKDIYKLSFVKFE